MMIFLSLLVFLMPVKIEHGRFNILKDGKKIGTDEFTVSMHGMNYAIDGKTTIGDFTISSQMELDNNLFPISYEASNAQGKMRVKIASPISELETVVNGETSTADFRFPEKGVILDNNLFHHYLILIYRAQTGQASFPVFVPQDRSIGSATVRRAGQHAYDLEVGNVKMEATTDVDGRLMKLTVPSANVVVERM
jgi:hypothetical protein